MTRRRPRVIGWALEPHICGACFGRVLTRQEEGAEREFRCSNCGATGPAIGHGPKSICACRARIGTSDAGIRCGVNVHRTPENPAEITAHEDA